MNNRLFYKLIFSFFFLFLICVQIGFVNKVQVVDAEGSGCVKVYEYYSYPFWEPCRNFNTSYNPRNETSKEQWTRLCEGTPGCRTCWWDGCPDGEYQCWGPWYDVGCNADNAGDTITCDCGNNVICPTLPPVTTAIVTNTPVKTNTPIPTTTTTVTPACNPNFTMSATFACNNETFKITGYPAVNTPRNGPSGVANDVVLGGTPIPPASCNLSGVIGATGITCPITRSGSLNWTHYYKTCSTPTNCNNTCTKTTNSNITLIPTPTCPLVDEGASSSCYVDPAVVYPNTQTSFIANIIGTPAQIQNKIFTSVGFGSCTGPNPANGNYSNGKTTLAWNCPTPIPGAPTHSFSLSYNYSNATCPDIKISGCSCGTNLGISPFPGYLRTQGGDLYVRDVNNNTTENLIEMRVYPTGDPSKSISTYNLSMSGDNTKIMLNSLPADCSGSICSTNKYLLWDYSDDNGPDVGGSYYTDINNLIIKKEGLRILTINNPWTYNQNQINEYDVIKVNSNVNIPKGSKCVGNKIFIIGQFLNIYPDFTNNDRDSSCLFVVNGNTIIKQTTGDTSRSTDTVEAFILTKSFFSDDDDTDDQLIVRGGLIVGRDNHFMRNINNSSSLIPNPEPSELIIYEGARYIKNLGHILSMPTRLDIQEKLPPVPTYNPNF